MCTISDYQRVCLRAAIDHEKVTTVFSALCQSLSSLVATKSCHDASAPAETVWAIFKDM